MCKICFVLIKIYMTSVFAVRFAIIKTKINTMSIASCPDVSSEASIVYDYNKSLMINLSFL